MGAILGVVLQARAVLRPPDRLPVGAAALEPKVGLAVAIEDAPGGAGEPIEGATLMVGDALTVHAVIYGTEGEFLLDAEVTWSATGGIGSIDPGPSTSATFAAEADGQGAIRADHPAADTPSSAS